MVGWHHRLNGHEFEQALGDIEGQGSLACYSPSRELDKSWSQRAGHSSVSEQQPYRDLPIISSQR